MNEALYQEAMRELNSAYPSLSAVTFAAKPSLKIVAEGDSWFDYPGKDVLGWLREDTWGNRLYQIEGKPKAGAYLNDMVYHAKQVADTLAIIRKFRPRAFIFSGGGNDIAGPELFDFLWNKAAGGNPAGGNRIINASVVTGVINEVFRQAYVDYIGVIQAFANQEGLGAIPIIFHGYGYAIPDGRGFMGGAGWLPGPWLDPSLTRKSWTRGLDDAARNAAIRSLIDALNDMLRDIANTQPNCHYLDLRPLLPQDPALWANELHPTREGFRLVANAFHQKLSQLIP